MGGSVLDQAFGPWSHVGGACPDVDDAAKLRGFFEAVQKLNREGKLLAYHDRSDGGVFVTLLEMAFASHMGLEIGFGDQLRTLFNEELGAVVAVRKEDVADIRRELNTYGLRAMYVANAVPGDDVVITRTDNLLQDDWLVYHNTRSALQKMWSETSFHVQSLRDNPDCAAEEFALLDDAARPGIAVCVPFDLAERVSAPFVHTARPRVAILREQGVNGQVEMGAVFDRAGFAAVDVPMSDLLAGRARLEDFSGLAACGGFSYGDVLGAGSGWAKTILFNERLKEIFSEFFHRTDTFSLGVCNGCQMMAQLRDMIPGAAAWPHFERNTSARFEARICMVEIPQSPSLFFSGMAGSQVPIVVAHGEGHVERVAPEAVVGLRYIDTYGKTTQHYPLNPSGSVDGIAGLTSEDGRALIVMPHPERVFLGVQHTWTRGLKDSPWQRMFDNARKWVG